VNHENKVRRSSNNKRTIADSGETERKKNKNNIVVVDVELSI